MKIKTKLTLGVGLLFILILLLGLVGAIYINALKADTENILVANYNTLDYAQNMLLTLEALHEKSIVKFEENLSQQERTITEIGEQEVTDTLRSLFEQVKRNPKEIALYPRMRKEIYKLMAMNMHAIQRKSLLAQKTAEFATFWIAITATLCFLIAFTLLINLPSNIANPIRELTESIQLIADEKYSERVHFEGHSEFGDLAKSFNVMAEKLEEYNNSSLARLMIEKKRIETLINIMRDPVLGLDENLNILFVNEEAANIIGIPQKDLAGKSAQSLAIQNDLIRSLLQEVLLDDKDQLPSKPVKIFAHGKESYFEKQHLNISILPTGEKQKKLIGHVIMLRNVTAYQELDFAKTNFIATVSHEFKTPISSIKMSLQLLENEQVGTLNSEQKNLVDSIRDDAERLLKITSELLNMSQIESGNLQLSLIQTDAADIFKRAILATKTQAEQKNIQFDLQFAENLPKVELDREKTSWVLTNLIANAIQYSYDRSTVYLSTFESDGKVCFSVRDTGQGIAPQYKERVFDRYFRVPGSKKEGTGLGLAISKELIEKQGGDIVLQTEFGVGSTFIVRLPKIS